MNYAGGKFDANGLGSHSSGYVNFEALPHHNHAETITVPDAHLLFAGDFERSGNDLIISDREHRLVVNDYFQGDKRPILMSPDGAPLDIKVVEALTGHTAYAQAGAPPAPKLVGHVVKLTGSASIVRNGVTVDVNTGDNVYQNDVVQTGSGSTVGLVLNDGTTFNMSANARLMLNDLVYDANSTSNTALFTLVQGAANFVAGQVAKTGDMKVATPVASIGIRGTAVILDISSTDGKVSISVVDQQDGQVHAVQVFNTRGDLIGTVTSNGASLTLTPTANFDVIAQQSNKTPAQVAQEFNAFQQVLSTYDVGKQQVPNLPPPTDGRRGDANPQSTTKFAGSTPVAPSDTPVTTLGTVGANTKNPVEIALADALSGKSTSSTSTGGATTSSNSSTQQQPATTIVVSDNTVVLQQVTIPPIAIPFVVTRPQVTLISTGAGDHFGPVMSADGRFVTYDPDGAIFLYDRQSNATATIASPANGFTYSVPSISSDGHYVVYQGSNGTQSFVFIYDNNPSDAAYQQTRQLAPGSAPAISGNGSTIVVEQVGGSIGVYDQQGHALASITPAAIGATGSLLKPAISADGHVIAFWNADGAPGGSGELFVYNVSTASVAAIASTVTGAGNTAASVSADGHYVVYQSDASDGHSEIFLYDLTAGRVVFQTANAGGASYNPVISPDGHFIIFASDARLTADDTNSVADTYVVDVTDPSHPVFKLVSALADGTVGNAASNLGASISAGGLFVAFGSNASNLSSGTGGSGNIFVVDPSSGHSAVIQESANAPAVLTASGLIELTGNSSGVTLTVSDPSGHFSAAFDANGNIQWNFSEVKSDFASLVPGQLVSRDYVITLSTQISTTTIPVKVSIFDADLPGVILTDVPPVASPVTLAHGQENVPYTITAADLLVGVVDIDGPSLSITSVSVASGGGSVIDNHDGTWTYTPQAGFFGVATFNYSASDGTLSASSIASLTLVAPDQAPVATPVTLAAGTEDTAYVINASTLLAGVTDVDGPSLSITLVSVASGGGSVVDNHNGTFTYTPAADYNGPVSLNYTASDGSLTSSSTASFTLAAVNDAPVALPVTLTPGAENTAYTINASTLLAGVSDVDGPSLSITSVSVASGGGSVVDNHDGTFTYIPAANYSGPVSFNYTSSDGSLSSSSTASLILAAAGDVAPVATPVTLAAGTEDTAYVINAATLLAGVTDVDGPSLSIISVSVASGGGSVVDNHDGTFTYTPAANYNGPVSFNYTASDGSLTSSSTASLTLSAVNDAPVATPVALAAGTEDTTYIINASTLLAGVTDVDGPFPLTITALNVASGGGSVVDNHNGTFTYTPAANYNGPVSFNYTASDGSLTSSSTASLTLLPVNDAPTVSGTVTGTANEDDTPQVLNALANASDVDHDTLAVVNIPAILPAGVAYSAILQSFILDPGDAAYQALSEGETTTVTVTYGVSDGVITTPASVSWTITGTDDAPVATPVALAAGIEDTSYVINASTLLAGVTDVDGPSLSITSVTVASGGGSVVDNHNGTFTYTPAANYSGPVSFNYTASDGALTSSSTASLILVAAGDVAPVATPVTLAAGTEDTAYVINASTLLAGVTDVDGPFPLTITALSVTSGGGSVVDNHNGTFTYTPAANYNGPVSFNYTASDGSLTSSSTASLTLTAVNDAPVATPVTLAAGTEDTAYVINASTLLAGVSDIDGPFPLTITSVTVASGGGSVVDNHDGTFTYTPAANYNGAVSFNYTASDGSLTSSSTASLTLAAVNDAPVAIPVALAAGTEDTAYVINAATLLAGVTDVDGPSLFITSVTVATGGGSVVDNHDGTFTYTPAANYNGPVSFNYTASDGSLNSSSTTSLTLAAVNDAPIAAPVTLVAGAENTPYIINASTLLAGVTDVDGPFPLTITSVTVASGGGSVVDNHDGTFTYTPAANYSGPVSFNYTASDGLLTSSSTASLTLTAVNDAPVATPVTLAAGTEDTAYVINAATLLAGVTDVDGPSLSITSVTVASGGGSVVDNHNGTFTYTPAANYNGPVSFNYTASDGLLSSSSTASLTLAAVNDAPVATPVTLAAGTEDAAYIINASTLLAGVSDIDGPFPLTVTALTVASGGGSVVDNHNGTFTYTPAANYNGPVSFNYTASDGSLTSNSTASLTLAAVNDAPIAAPVTLAAGAENTPYIVNASTLLAGVTDVDGPFPLTITALSVTGGGGSIVDNHDGTFTYTPATNYSGPVSFNYTASDGSLSSSSTASLNLNSSGVITGTPNADVLLGTSQADVMFGLGGNDRLQGFAGNDQLDGGTGFDRAIYSDATGGISVNLAAGTASGPGVGTDTLVGIEGVVGSDFADTFDATGFMGDTSTPGTPIGFNEFEGRGGNDIITTSVNGFGAALTRVSYVSATGAVTVDIAAGTADGDASVGHDTFIGSGVLSVFGSAFADTLSGSNNGFGTIEVFDGRAGNDTINGRGGFDRADYNNDPATTSGITVHLAAGTVTGDSTIGTDTLISVEAVRGSNFNDVYDATGFSGSSTNAGSLGTFNEFTGEGGNDTIIGNGNTRLSFTNATAGVTVDIAAGTATGDASVGSDTFTGVNAVMGSMFADSLSGSAGNEIFTGLGGNDVIDGRGGFDTVSYNNIYLSTGGVSVNLAAGTATGDASIGTDTLRSIEGIQGTNAADIFVATGYGDLGALNVGDSGTFNQFEGLAGNDTITGSGFTRLLYTNATGGVSINLQGGTATGDASVGSDTFTGVYSVTGSNFADVYDASNFNGTLGLYNEFQGLAGNDAITGNGSTRLYYTGATGGVSINLHDGTAIGDASVGSDTFSGVYSVMGSNFADVYNASNFTGTTFDAYNEFQGFAGNDIITGNGSTQIQYLSATSGVTVDMQAGTAIGDASVGQDTFSGVNSVAGSNFNDVLRGDSGDDFLSGFDGNDLLDGRAGNDVLTGGTGADTFVYADGGGADIITDFNRAEGDLIDVTGVSGIFSFADIQSRTTSAGGTTVIDFGNGNLLSLSVANVQQSDFIFNNSSITGTPGPDVLLGTSQADAIFGLGGNDRLQGFAGNDQLNGGTGFDRAIYSDATGGITVNLAAGTVSGAGVGTDSLIGIEGVVGSDFADTFDATGFTGDTSTPGTPIGFNEFEGRGGNDTIIGLTNSQGALLTRVSYVSATAGVNVNFATGTADGNASVGHDTFIGAGVANVSGSAFADTLTGSNNPSGTVETFDGRAGNDIIDGGGGFDRADYNLDPAVTAGITVHLAAGTVIGDSTVGTDTLISIEAVRGTNFDDTYDATGFSGSSINAGSLGTFNEFTGVGGNDTIIGNGNTRLSFNSATASVTFDIVLGTAIGADGSIGTDHFSGVNAIQATMFNDTLLGSGNNENFTGLAGDDFIDGRGGFDTAIYNNVYFTTGAVSVNMMTGDVFGDISSGHDTLRSIEAIQGTNFADTYNATGFGAAGLDPNQFNVGSNGTFNQFEGMGGDDSITGNGNTRIIFTNATSGVSINLQAGSAIGDASVGHDTFTGVNSASGSNFNDTFVATSFNGINGTFNTFQGLGGDDTITGNGNTQIFFTNATAGVTVDLTTGNINGDASVGHDIITGGVFNVLGSNFNDTISGSASNDILNGAIGNDTIDGRAGNDTLTGGAGSDIFVYADAGGADTVTDFNRAEGDKIDVTAVSSVLSFADIQSRTSVIGGNTVINFGGGNTLTLNGVPAVQQSDFVFRVVDDRSVLVTKGSSVVLTNADLDSGDSADTLPANVIYTITATSHGSLQKSNGVTSQTLAVGSSFSLDDIEHGLISFATADGLYVGAGGFDVSVSVAGVPKGSAFVGVSIFDAQITVLATTGYDFNQDDPATKMGSSTNTIAPGYTSTTFTLIDAADNRDFIFVGTGFNTDGTGHPYSSGTITSIIETTDDPSHTPLAHLELNVDALTWYNAVVAKANGDQSLLENLTRPWAINFNGNAGADAFNSSDVNDLFTGNGGNDTFDGQFGYDRAAYTHATGAVDVELAAGTVTDRGVNPTGIGQDTLRSIELVTGSNYDDLYNATGFGLNSTNAGSAVTANTLGLFNEFEGRAGNDQITGNGTTRISYFHATSGVTVTFTEGSWTSSSSGASGIAVGDASVGQDTFTGVYSIRGSFYDDTFTGSTNPFGTSENFEGLGGNDTINGGGGFDRAVYDNSFSGSGINVQLANGTVTPTNATAGAIDIGTDTLRSVEGIWGTDFDDVYNAAGFSTTSTNAGSSQISATNPGASNFNEFEGAGGNDTITGNGNTRVAYYHSTAGVAVTLGANGSGTADGDASVGHDTFVSGVTRVTGSEFNDILTGNGGNNILDGRGGDDVLVGNGGDDTLIGGAGADIFVMKAGNNVTDGNSPASNNDTISDFSHSDGDRIDLSRIASIHNLADVLSHASQVSSNVVIDFGYLALTDPTSLIIQNVTLANLTASDFIFAGEVAVTVQTLDGYDFSTLYGDLAASNPVQPANNATHVFAVDLAKGTTFEMIGTGFTYDGTGHVNGGTITEIDILNTTDPTQTTQDHVLVNTNGWSISASAFVSDISQYASLDPVTHAAGLTALNGIFNAATYSIVGADGEGIADGRTHAGADVFFGGNQADVFNGMPGSFGPGDPGNDTVDYSHAGAAVTASLLTGSGSAGAATGDIYISIENLRGSDFNDILTGDGNNNVIEGGLGNDTLDGGGGADTVSYEHATDFVTVDLSKSVQQDTHGAGLDTLSNFETVLGSSFADTLTGNGNSMLEGGPGNDHLIGQPGQNDTASYQHAVSGVTVSLNIAGAQNTGGAGTDTLTNINNLFGSQFSDNLTGNNNANTLDGGFSNSDAHDILTGLGGADKFVFNSGDVTITDFSEADHDLVDISHANNGSGFSDAQLAALLAGSTGDAIDFGNGNVLTFANITNVSAQLHASDFLHT